MILHANCLPIPAERGNSAGASVKPRVPAEPTLRWLRFTANDIHPLVALKQFVAEPFLRRFETAPLEVLARQAVEHHPHFEGSHRRQRRHDACGLLVDSADLKDAQSTTAVKVDHQLNGFRNEPQRPLIMIKPCQANDVGLAFITAPRPGDLPGFFGPIVTGEWALRG